MKHIFLILLLFPLLIISQETKEIHKYENETYSIKYPSNWILDNSGENGTKIYLYPKESSNSDIFVENINLLIQNINDSSMTIESCKILIEKQVAAMMTNHKISVSEIVNKDGKNFHKLISEGSSSNYNFKTIIYTWLINKKLYTLTFVTLLEDYENNNEVSKEIMDSFKIEEN